MSQLVYLPIEEIPSRYGKMMNHLIYGRLTPSEQEITRRLVPDCKEYDIRDGQFLDNHLTGVYKSRQMALVLQAMQENAIKDGDTLLVHDVFYPGLEHIRYASELSGKRLRIAAFNFAGRADPTDFVQKLGRWADFSERSWHSCCDLILVGSVFHKKQVELFLAQLDADMNCPKVVATGYPWDASWVTPFKEVKSKYINRIAWPHRMCDEKGLPLLKRLGPRLTDQGFCIKVLSGRPFTQEEATSLKSVDLDFAHCVNKSEYYRELSACNWMLATGKQETFGYALHEAQALGLGTICPRTACYPEFVSPRGLFNFSLNLNRMVDRISHILMNVAPFDTHKRSAKITGSAEEIVQTVRS